MVYHTPQWKHFLEKVFGYSPVYLFALGDFGEVVAFLPMFRMNCLFSGTRLCSVPFGHVCAREMAGVEAERTSYLLTTSAWGVAST